MTTHDTGIDEDLTKAIYDAMQIPYLSERHDAIKELIKAQRQADLEKLSFHLGVDVKTLQGYLESNVSK